MNKYEDALLKMARERLDSKETIIGYAFGNYEGKIFNILEVPFYGVLIATENKLVIFSKGFSKRYELKVFPYKSIDCIITKKNLIGTITLCISASGEKISVDLSGNNSEPFVDILQSRIV